jgi:MFS transporter, DHA1 family, multidrug resistance protein
MAQGNNIVATKPPPSFALAALITTLVALGPLSTDLYLPALPTLARVFATDAGQVQLTLSAFLAGFALAQLAYGPLSDRFGRRPVMLGGLALYLIGTLWCILAASIDALIAARVLQAVGACAGPVLGRAVVRDVWGPLDSARVLAYVSGAMAMAPLIGPTLGGNLTVHFGWQANFVALALISGLQTLAVWWWLKETNHQPDATATRPRQILRNFQRLLADRAYVGYVLSLAFSYSALFAFISGSPFLLIGGYGLTPQAFGLCFGVVVAGYIAGATLSGRLVSRYGADRLLMAGGWLGSVAGWLMWALDWSGVHHPAALLAPMFVVAMTVGMVMPNAVSRALAPYPQMAGAAASLMGFCQMGIAALVGIAVGHNIELNGQALAIAVAACGTLVPLCYAALVRR